MTQFSLFDTAPSPPAAVVWAPPARLPDGSPLLQLRVRCLPLWWDFAWLVLEGIKLLETRGWCWAPREPAWVAMYATLGRGKKTERPLLPKGVVVPDDAPKGVITGIIWIPGSRPLVETDTAAACFPFGPGRHAFPIGARHRFKVPVSLAQSGLKKGPQGPVFLARDIVSRALAS